MSVREKDDSELYARIQERNLLRQYDLLTNCIEIGLTKGIESLSGNPITLPAYALWRLNWIHPFVEGNGRTARAACYYLACVKLGQLLPGKKIVPERIRENRTPYYAALRDADLAWEQGHFDVSSLTQYLSLLLREQLSEA